MKALWFLLLGACSGQAALQTVDRTATNPVRVAASQDGTVADGVLRADARGHFVADVEARRALEYMFSATGERDEATLQAQAGAAIDAQLQGRAREEARAMLSSYVGYRAAAQTQSPPHALSERVAVITSLRAQYFDASTRQGFFADDEQRVQIGIAAQSVRSDASLSNTDRVARLGALDARLPAGDIAVRDAALQPVQSLRAEAALRLHGDSTDAVHAQRVQTLGEEGAARLAALDGAHANFNAIVASLRALRERLAASGGAASGGAASGGAARDVAATLEQAIVATVPVLEQAHARALLAQ